MNVICITGGLTKDAEVSTTTSGTSMLKFSVANKIGYGEHEKVNYFNCVIWGKRAEGRLAEFLTKGTQVAVTGELDMRVYQKKDGDCGASLEVNVNNVDLIGSKGKQEEKPAAKPVPDDFDDSDLPF